MVAGLPHPTLAALVTVVAWAGLVPYLADAAGLRLDVDRRLEVVDHVVPAVLAAVLAGFTGAARPASWRWLAAAAVVSLAGLWITTTHVALVSEVLDGASAAGLSLLHLSAGPPLAALGLWLLLRPPEPARSRT